MKLIFSITTSLLLLLFTACNIKPATQTKESLSETSKIQIGISKAKGSKGYLKYGEWLNNLDTNVIYFDLYFTSLDSALDILSQCDGLLVSGGPDVDPNRYGEDIDTTRCESIDFRRDSLEYALIEYALNIQMPILGICRGEQILNVYFGGSLYQDIPTDQASNIGHRFTHIDSSYHQIQVVTDGLLYEICGSNSNEVNSSHHQAIKHLGNGLMVLARTNDSIIESISWSDSKGKGFLLGVQWHPEWLKRDNPFSTNIGQQFLKQAYQFNSTKNYK